VLGVDQHPVEAPSRKHLDQAGIGDGGEDPYLLLTGDQPALEVVLGSVHRILIAEVV